MFLILPYVLQENIVANIQLICTMLDTQSTCIATLIQRTFCMTFLLIVTSILKLKEITQALSRVSVV